MIVLGVYLLLYYARLNNEKQILNEMEEEVIATLLFRFLLYNRNSTVYPHYFLTP